MFSCKFCNKVCYTEKSFTRHENSCTLNAQRRIKVGGGNQYTKARKLGLPDPIMSKSTKELISESAKVQNSLQWDRIKRKQHSQIMNNAVKENPNSYTTNNVCGRVKIFNYKGKRLKGSWELIVAKWLDEQEILWDTEVNPQPYVWNNSIHQYFPDFYLPKEDVYIEVKGYKRERDLAKWAAFKGTLIIIEHHTIKKIDSLILKDLLVP